MAVAKKRILLADDQEVVRRLVGVTLGEDEFDLVYATDGEEALRLAQETRPDLVLLDIMMPGIDGFQVCRALKNDPETSRISILILTAKGSEADRAMGKQVGADGYFSKPFSPIALLGRVHELLDKEGTEASGQVEHLLQSPSERTASPLHPCRPLARTRRWREPQPEHFPFRPAPDVCHLDPVPGASPAPVDPLPRISRPGHRRRHQRVHR
ncbi:MAG: response regulator [Chloroflexota bacterium]|nr:MAG: response regulator [Chloroflexota bacterium]